MVREVRLAWDDALNPHVREELQRRLDFDDGPDMLEPDPCPRRPRSRRRRRRQPGSVDRRRTADAD